MPSETSGAQSGQREAVLTPPRVRHLPALRLPPGTAGGVDSVEVTAVVDVHGHATLESTTATDETLRAAIAEALDGARFVPATREGAPITARVRLSFSLVDEAANDGTEGEALPAGDADAPAEEATDGLFGATAQVDPPRPTARSLELREMREVPGAFGDPFRVLDTLPGVVPVLSGLPYVYVRGSPPAGTGYYYDGIAVPALFHLALGPAVIHPAMIGDLDFYPALPPARYGRQVGGLFSGSGKHGGGAGPDGGVAGEIELRLIDLQAMVDVQAGRTRVTAAGRYGYPGLVLGLIEPEALLDYWDYQLRMTHLLSARDRVEMVVFGSYDIAGDRDDVDSQLNLQFHRAELRLIRTLPGFEIGSAVQVGYERTGLGDEFGISAARIGPRMWVLSRLSDSVRIRAGADMLASFGKIRGGNIDFDGDATVEDEASFEPPMFADPNAGEVDIPSTEADEANDEPTLRDAAFSQQATRNVMGLWADLQLDLTTRWLLQPGVRFDAWLSGTEAEAAVDPRLLTSYQLTDALRTHVAVGMGHQSTTPPIPLPALNDIALEKGLQRAYKGEAGIAWDVSEGLLVETEGFYNHMTDVLIFPVDCDGVPDGPLRDECDRLLPRATLDAYGLEVFIKRPADERLSGWVSYTLGWVVGDAGGQSFTPNADVRHLGNLVLQYKLSRGWSCGLRFFGRSGKVVNVTSLTARQNSAGPVRPLQLVTTRRLPGFYRADAQFNYRWKTSFGQMRLTLEWMNFTLSEEPVTFECDFGECYVEYAPAITIPNIGLRGSF